jgi:hypothetical protein
MSKKSQLAPRRAPSVPKARFEALQLARSAATRRAKVAAQERVGAVVGAAAGYGLGYMEKKGHKLPSIGGVEPTLLAGLALTFGPTLLGQGNSKLGRVAAEFGSASLSIAAYKAGLGQPMVSGEDE